jgi:deazaflavin-dependent oxidoreductase (nitroreductase family)
MVVLVASNGGDERDPQWYRNILVCPAVSIAMHGETQSMTARVAVGSERSDLWHRIREVGPTYHLYQSRTARQLPVVVLEPAPGVEAR